MTDLTPIEAAIVDRIEASYHACANLCLKKQATPEAMITVEDGLTCRALTDTVEMFEVLQDIISRGRQGWVICVGCDEQFRPDAIRDHIADCEAHPLYRVAAERDTLQLCAECQKRAPDDA